MSKSRIPIDSKTMIMTGVFITVLSSPILYLMVASTIIDIQNLFGASIDRRSVSFDTNDPFIQAMGIVTIVGYIFLGLGLGKRWAHK